MWSVLALSFGELWSAATARRDALRRGVVDINALGPSNTFNIYVAARRCETPPAFSSKRVASVARDVAVCCAYPAVFRRLLALQTLKIK